MDSKTCNNILNEHTKKTCGAIAYFDYAANEQCPKFCAHCGAVLNPDFVEEEDRPRLDGPTIVEWIDAGEDYREYPPKGYLVKGCTVVDFKRIHEMKEAELTYQASQVDKAAKN